MRLNMGIKDFDNGKPAGTPVKPPGIALPGLTAGHRLHPAHQSQLTASVPPLSRHVWHQLDYFKEKGSRLLSRVTNYANSIVARVLHPPLSAQRAFITSTVWQRALDFVWFQRHRTNRLLQKALGQTRVTRGEPVADNAKPLAERPYRNKAFRRVLAPEADTLSSTMIKSELLPPVSARWLEESGDRVGREAGDSLRPRPERPTGNRWVEEIGERVGHEAGKSLRPRPRRPIVNRVVEEVGERVGRKAGKSLRPRPRRPTVNRGVEEVGERVGHEAGKSLRPRPVRPTGNRGIEEIGERVEREAGKSLRPRPVRPTGNRWVEEIGERVGHEEGKSLRPHSIRPTVNRVVEEVGERVGHEAGEVSRQEFAIKEQSPTPNVSQSEAPPVYQPYKIGAPRYQPSDAIKEAPAQPEWQPPHTSYNEWPDSLLPPLIADQIPSTKAPYGTHQDIPLAYTIAERYKSFLLPTEPVTRAQRRVLQKHVASNIMGRFEAVTPAKNIAQTVGDYAQPVGLTGENDSFRSLPEYIETGELRTEPNKVSRGFPPDVRRHFGLEWSKFIGLPIFKSIMRVKKPTKDLPINAGAIPPVGETLQAMELLPLAELVNRRRQIVERGETARRANIPRELSNMVHIPANVTEGTSSKVRTGPAPEAGIAGIPLSNKEAEYLPELHHEKSLITQNTHRTMNLPLLPNFESEPSVRLPYEVSRYNVLRHKDSEYPDYGSSFINPYTDTLKHTRHSDLGQPLTPVAEVGTGGGDSEDKRVLAATFSARAYYSNQPPKLELSPALKTTTTSSNPATNPVVEEESTTGEAPDIDAIARDVYSKLKRRLATERERVRGLA